MNREILAPCRGFIGIGMVSLSSKQPSAAGGGGRVESTTAMALLVAAAATVAVLVYPDILKTGDGGDGRLEYELGPLLSPGASIFLPGTAEFRDKTTRWIDSLSPDIGAVVAVATEEDIQQTVRAVFWYVPKMSALADWPDIGPVFQQAQPTYPRFRRWSWSH